MGFENQTIIVTGGGVGIGKHIALTFGREKGNVVLAARSQDKMEAVAEELRGMGTKPLVCPMDVSSEEQCREMVSKTLAQYGKIDVLVNNSGIAGPTKLARDITSQEWLESMDVNLNGAFYCAKYVSAPMIEAKGGNIINVSSTAGRIGFPMRTPYAASKWGMIGLGHSLAAELGPYGIRVNTICPGPIAGDRLDAVIQARAKANGTEFDHEMDLVMSTVPMRRLSTEQEVADTVVYLASDAASGISGQAFNVDGGFRMQ